MYNRIDNHSTQSCTLGDVQGQQCPHNDIQRIIGDVSRAVPLTSPLCFQCVYFVGGSIVTPTDITWSRGPSPFITLTNGSMNGNVLIDPNTDILILPNPINVINVGNTLRCNSATQGQHLITITQFSKLIQYIILQSLYDLTV